MRVKILICTNPLDHEGGVVNYYRIFFKRFSSSRFELVHLDFGSRMQFFYRPRIKRLLYPIYYAFDMIRLIIMLLGDRRIRIIQISPSLIPVPLIRDGLILLAARITGRRTIVFFRGWKQYVVDYMMRHRWAARIFRVLYQKADCSIVLAGRFIEDLQRIGFNTDRFVVSTTMIEDDLILKAEPSGRGDSAVFLYLGRISKLKGFEEIIQAAALMKNRRLEFRIDVVGHEDQPGSLDRYQEEISRAGLTDFFTFWGRLTDERKYIRYAEADAFVLPSWQEGCPTSVLEALGSGLYVVSSDAGALREIIRPEFNGVFVAMKDPAGLAAAMIRVCETLAFIRRKRHEIQIDALSRYSAGSIITTFEKMYEGVLNE